MNPIEYKCQEQWLHSMSANEAVIADVRLKSKSVVDSNRQGPHDFIRIHYSGYTHLLLEQFRQSFQEEEQDPATWEQTQTVAKKKK